MARAAKIRKATIRGTTAGFSLLETMFALFILCVAVALLAATMTTAIHADADNQSQNAGLFLANQEAQEIVAAFHALRTPCGASPLSACASFTDSHGVSVDLSDTSPQILQLDGDINFSSAAVTGYDEKVVVGGSQCSQAGTNTVAGCQVYDIRWNITTPVLSSLTVGANTASNVQLPHQITVGVRAEGGGNFAPVNVHVATP